jgi:hypothetical protein
MSARPARSVLEELRPPSGWHQPTAPAVPPEPPITRQAGASDTDPAEPLAAPASPAGPPPVAAARPRPDETPIAEATTSVPIEVRPHQPQWRASA